jgi:hypothetical protein
MAKKITIEKCSECPRRFYCEYLCNQNPFADCPLPDDNVGKLEARVKELEAWKERAIAKMRTLSPCPAKEQCPGPDAACSCYECLDDAFSKVPG